MVARVGHWCLSLGAGDRDEWTAEGSRVSPGKMVVSDLTVVSSMSMHILKPAQPHLGCMHSEWTISQ